MSFWLGRAVGEVLRLGGTADELRALAGVAAALRMKAVQAPGDAAATTPPPPPR